LGRLLAAGLVLETPPDGHQRNVVIRPGDQDLREQ
jgi:hypothetical protein